MASCNWTIAGRSPIAADATQTGKSQPKTTTTATRRRKRRRTSELKLPRHSHSYRLISSATIPPPGRTTAECVPTRMWFNQFPFDKRLKENGGGEDLRSQLFLISHHLKYRYPSTFLSSVGKNKIKMNKVSFPFYQSKHLLHH